MATVVRSFGWRHRIGAIVFLAAVISPVLRDRDSVPLSTYPMYADRGARLGVLATAVGVDAAGAVHRLSLETIAGTDDPLIAESSLDDAIRAGRAGALCAQIAARAGGQLVRIEVVEERHDLVARAKHESSLLERRLDASCEVSR
jgi:hypothetical protein